MSKFIIALAAAVIGAAASGLARAQEEDAPRSRAEVIAELDAARASGELAAMVGEDSGSMFLAALPFSSQRTRAQVQAEVIEARRSGELNAFAGEDSGLVYLAQGVAPAAAMAVAMRHLAERSAASADAVLL